MSIRTICSAVVILLLGTSAAYTVEGRTHTNCEVKTVIGLPFETAPKTVISSCGLFFTGPHAKKGLMNIDNIADMNRAAENNTTVTVKTTGWPLPVAYVVS